MSSYKHHLKVDHDGDVENIRAARKTLRELVETKGDSLTAADLAKFFDHHLSGLEGHKHAMSQQTDNLYDEVVPQSQLVPAQTDRQPYLARSAGNGDRLVPDNIHGVTVPTNANLSPEFQKLYGVPEDQPTAVIPIPRVGAPSMPIRSSAPLELEFLVKSPLDES